MRIGNPEQNVRVLISTASEATYVVLPGGCPANTPGITPSLTCSHSRGELFDPSLYPSSWSSFGNYSLGLEANLGYNDPGNFGLDTIALGLNNATGGPTLQDQVVAGFETYDYYTGLFGLGNQPVNLTGSTDANNFTGITPHSSFLTTMKSKNLIPSLSWAYTAGANYRECEILHRPRITSTSTPALHSLRELSLCFFSLRTDTSSPLCAPRHLSNVIS